MAVSDFAIFRKPLIIYSTKLKSLVGFNASYLILRCPPAICVMIVGITGLADWHGPYVLNGRIIETGFPNKV